MNDDEVSTSSGSTTKHLDKPASQGGPIGSRSMSELRKSGLRITFQARGHLTTHDVPIKNPRTLLDLAQMCCSGTLGCCGQPRPSADPILHDCRPATRHPAPRLPNAAVSLHPIGSSPSVARWHSVGSARGKPCRLTPEAVTTAAV